MGDVVSGSDGVKADQAKPAYAAHPTPAVVVAIPLGLVAPVATLALSIFAGSVSFIVPAILVAGLALVIRHKRPLLGMTLEGTVIAGLLPAALAALFASSALQVANQQQERDDRVRQIVALGRSDPEAQKVRIAGFDEPMLDSLKKIAPALEARERARRTAEAQQEKVRAQVAAAEQKRLRIAELERSLTSVARNDFMTSSRIYRELYSLAPERHGLRQKIIDLVAEQDRFRRVQEHPEHSLVFSNSSWGAGGFGSVMLISTDVKNVSAFTLKDFTIECTNRAPSGTELNTNSRIVYERIEPGRTKRLRNFNMGFMANQVASTSCQITGAVIEE